MTQIIFFNENLNHFIGKYYHNKPRTFQLRKQLLLFWRNAKNWIENYNNKILENNKNSILLINVLKDKDKIIREFPVKNKNLKRKENLSMNSINIYQTLFGNN